MADDTKETGTTTRTTRSTSRSSRTSTRSSRSSRSTATPPAASTPKPKPAPKKVSAPSKKSWADKVAAKNKQLDKLLLSERKFGGRLTSGVIKEIKKRVSDKGPSAVSRMHFLGSPRQRKELARVIESILDS